MIAEESGFGQSTVSMALRNDPRIPEETRRKILAVSTRLGYRPDPQIARLMSAVKRRNVQRHVQTLAFVLLWNKAEDYYHYRTYGEYRSGAAVRAAEFGYALEDFVVNEEGITPQRLSTIMRTRALPGMLIAPTSLPHLRTGQHGMNVHLIADDYALATIGFTLAYPVVNRAMHDHALGAEMAVEELRKRHVRRIGLVMSQATHARVEGRWLSGFLLAQEKVPTSERVRTLLMDNINDTSTFAEWYKREKPDVITGVEMREIRGHLEAMRMRVPKDVGLAHLDVSEEDRSIAGVVQHNEAIGAAAFDLLLGQILRNERGVPAMRKTVMIEGSWRDGPSLRAK